MLLEDIPDYKLGEVPDDLPEENPHLYRLIIAKRALLAGHEELDNDGTPIIIDMLTDLRHLCDALGVDFAYCDRIAYGHYIAEKGEFANEKKAKSDGR